MSPLSTFAIMLVVVGVVRGQTINVPGYGMVTGQTIDVNLESGSVPITSFWGIPYAQPPVGDLRFEPPQKHPGLTGEFIAATLPNMCMQNPVGLMFMTHPFWTKYSEDCLVLNIFKPRDITAPLAVFVWFHGGGYTGGGNIQYPGHFLAARNTVVVIVNYRLGVFGYSNTPGGTIKGNMGMLDQVMALEFVRDNIAAFGGNPLRVTIFGQSAGASSSALHVVSPRSRGLFHQAIFESGSENNIWTLNYPAQTPELYIYQVANKLNCTISNEQEMVACLKAASQRDLRIADSIECTPGYFCQGFAPIVDGPGGFMPDIPLKLRMDLGANSVPIIAGHCKDDGSLYTIYFIPEAEMQDGFTKEEYELYLRERLIDIFKPRLDSITYENTYQAVEWQYRNWNNIDDPEGNRQSFNKLLTDAAFGFPWDRNAKINSDHSSTFTYIQSFRGVNATSFIPEWMGVPHNGELPYVWGYGYLLINPAVRNDTGIHFDIMGWTPEDMTYANYVQTLWSNFAKFGNPTPTPVKAPFNDTMTTWPLYNSAGNHKVLDLNGEILIKENYRQQDYAFFTDYMSYVTGEDVVAKESKKTMKQKPTLRLNTKKVQDFITRKAIELIKNRYPGRYDKEIEEFIQNEL